LACGVSRDSVERVERAGCESGCFPPGMEVLGIVVFPQKERCYGQHDKSVAGSVQRVGQNVQCPPGIDPRKVL
jgi:hypothetical protein